MTQPKNPKVLKSMTGLNSTQAKSIGVPKGYKHVARVRAENEALPITFKETKSEHFKFPVMEPVRPGANDHLKINRKGICC